MTYIYIKLKNGKEGKIWQQELFLFESSKNCSWCGKTIKPGRMHFQADGNTSWPCCSMAHAKALLNAKI